MTENSNLMTSMLEGYGDELRAAGRLEEAADTFRRLLVLDPAHIKAERLLASILGTPARLPSLPSGVRPAPFVVKRDFLPPAMREELFAALRAKADRFTPALLNQSYSDEETRRIRRSLYLPSCLHALPAAVRDAFVTRLYELFAGACMRLRIAPFKIQSLETHALIYRDGDLFVAHRDTGRNNTRRITFVYDLHLQPRPFQGGDLLLHDTLIAPPDLPPSFVEAHTRIVSEDNRIVFFPSEFFHQVVPVRTGPTLLDARFVVSGWFHTTETLGALESIALTPY